MVRLAGYLKPRGALSPRSAAMLYLNLSTGPRTVMQMSVPGVSSAAEFIYDLRNESLVVTPVTNIQTGGLTGILLQENNKFLPVVGTVLLEKMSFSVVQPDAGDAGILMEGLEKNETEDAIAILFSNDSIVVQHKAETQPNGLLCKQVHENGQIKYLYTLRPLLN